MSDRMYYLEFGLGPTRDSCKGVGLPVIIFQVDMSFKSCILPIIIFFIDLSFEMWYILDSWLAVNSSLSLEIS